MIGAYVLAGILTFCMTMICVTLIAKWSLDYAKRLETEQPGRLLSSAEVADRAQDDFKLALKHSEELSMMANSLRAEGRRRAASGYGSLAKSDFRKAAVFEKVAKRLRMGQCTIIESDELLAKKL
jgi:ribosomal protein L44E